MKRERGVCMTYDRKAVGKEIRKRRLAMGLTQEQAAEKIDRALRFYSRIELGDVGMSVDTLLAICGMLKTTPDALLIDKPIDAVGANRQWIAEAIANCPAEKQQTAIDLLKVYLKSI